MSSQYCIDLAPGYTISRLLKGGWQLAGGHGSVDRATAIARSERKVTLSDGKTLFYDKLLLTTGSRVRKRPTPRPRRRRSARC